LCVGLFQPKESGESCAQAIEQAKKVDISTVTTSLGEVTVS